MCKWFVKPDFRFYKDAMSPATLADCILIFHALFVAVVVLSVPLIALGGLCGWQWVRNPWFRFGHLAMIAFVAGESLVGMACPLTVWENQLRISASEQGYGNEDFIAAWLSRLIFYHFPPWVFTVAYVGFALLVAGLFYFVPVRKRQ
jgi:hypothetical protein